MSIRKFVLVPLLFGSVATSSMFAQTLYSESLDGTDWQFHQLIGEGSDPKAGNLRDWMPAKVPGDVHLDLIANKRIPDPFDRDDERLRNHPSITLWSGNNETESLREWNGRGQLPADVHEHIWQDYLTEFSGVLAVAAANQRVNT